MISLDLENLYIWESSHIKTATPLIRDISNILMRKWDMQLYQKHIWIVYNTQSYTIFITNIKAMMT